MSIRDDIVAAAVTALNTGRPGGIPASSRTRTISIDPASLPTMTIYPKKDSVASVHSRVTPIVRRTLEIWVECLASGNGPTPGASVTADAAIDDLTGWAQRLVGQTFGGIAISTYEIETDFEYETAKAVPVCRATVRIAVDYTTRPNDSTVRA